VKPGSDIPVTKERRNQAILIHQAHLHNHAGCPQSSTPAESRIEAHRVEKIPRGIRPSRNTRRNATRTAPLFCFCRRRAPSQRRQKQKRGRPKPCGCSIPQPPQYDEAAARTNRTTASSMIQMLCGTSASPLTSYRSAARNHCTWVRAILPLKDSVISASASFWLFQENIARSFGPTVSRCG